MKEQKIKELFQQAEKDLNRAQEELYRPLEDVVTFSACMYTRRALHSYLLVYAQLLAEEKKEKLTDDKTIEKLLEFIGKYSTALKNVDFSEMNCKCNEISEVDEDLTYCTNVNKVNYCSEISTEVREILISKDPSLAA